MTEDEARALVAKRPEINILDLDVILEVDGKTFIGCPVCHRVWYECECPSSSARRGEKWNVEEIFSTLDPTTICRRYRVDASARAIAPGSMYGPSREWYFWFRRNAMAWFERERDSGCWSNLALYDTWRWRQRNGNPHLEYRVCQWEAPKEKYCDECHGQGGGPVMGYPGGDYLGHRRCTKCRGTGLAKVTT